MSNPIVKLEIPSSQGGPSSQYIRADPKTNNYLSPPPVTMAKPKKVAASRYSKLALAVRKFSKDTNKTDEVSVVSADSSLSSHDIISGPKGCVITFGEGAGALCETKKKKSIMFRRKKDSHHDLNIPEHYSHRCRSLTIEEQSKKATQKTYSRLAFSVQHVGSKKEKMNRNRLSNRQWQ